MATARTRPERLVCFVVEPTAVYSPDFLRKQLGLKRSTFAYELKRRRLRYVQRAGRNWLLGEHVLEWLRAGERRRGPASAEGGG